VTKPKVASLAVFWADTRTLLSARERLAVMSRAVIESITPAELLMRTHTGRLVAVTAATEKSLWCDLCAEDSIRAKYGGTCPSFAKCCSNGRHRGKPVKLR
jgi:hypothetical protein